MHREASPTTVAPKYTSWDDFLTRATGTEVRQMCHARTKKANAERLLSAAPERSLTARDVWEIMATAGGRCVHCGSFCVERLPYDGKVKLAWAPVGRRVGSVDHVESRVDGGGNERENLAWACLWCNTWGCERQRAAADHGGLYPPDDGHRSPLPPPWRVRNMVTDDDELADASDFVDEDDPLRRSWS